MESSKKLGSPTYTDLSNRAIESACEYLVHATDYLDKKFGVGGAEARPQIVAALVQAAANEYLTSVIIHCVIPELQLISGAIHNVQESVERLGEDWATPEDGSGDPDQF